MSLGRCDICEGAGTLGQARRQRDRLLAVCKAVYPLLDGLLMEHWGHQDNWPKDAAGTVIFNQLRDEIAELDDSYRRQEAE